MEMNNPKVPNPTPEGSMTAGISSPGQVAVDKKGTLDDQLRQPGPQISGTIYAYKGGR